jgi:hypothetical protein
MALSGQILLINVWRSWGGIFCKLKLFISWKLLDTEAWMYTGPERRTPENIHNEAREENSDDQSI